MIALQVARRDLLEMSRDGRLRWAGGVLLLLLAVSVWVGWTRSTQAAALQRAATDVQHEAWLEKGAMHPHMAAHYGMFLFKPVPPLAAVDRGIDDYVGSFVFLEAHKQNLFAGRPAADAPPGARFGELTAATALQVLVPLVIVLLTFSTFAGEREQGTLRQALATGVRGWKLVLGKTLAVALLLACVLLPAVLLGAGLALVDASAVREEAGRAAALALVYLAYFTIWAAVGLWVSARAATSRQALAGLLAFWFATCLLAPRLGADLAGFVHPAPLATAFDAAIEEDFAQMIPFPQRVEAVTKRLVAEYGVAGPEALPVSPIGFALSEGEAESSRIYRRHVDALFDIYERQEQVGRIVGLLAPALALQHVSNALSGTDLAHHRRFAAAAEAYRLDLVQPLNRAIAVNDEIAQRPGDETFYAGYLRGRDLWAELPRFEYVRPPLGWAASYTWTSTATLLLWLSAATAGLLASVRRLRV